MTHSTQRNAAQSVGEVITKQEELSLNSCYTTQKTKQKNPEVFITFKQSRKWLLRYTPECNNSKYPEKFQGNDS